MSILNPAIKVRGVSKVFDTRGSKTVALDNVSLEIKQGEFVAFLGPSGCGKSTLLRMMAGLTDTTSGDILIENRPVTGRDPSVGMVFQSYTSFPWLSVADNIGFGLQINGVGGSERRRKIDEMLDRVDLRRVATAYPSQLSGGMQQRVAIARALAVNPKILLMDEPFGALDAMTRLEMQAFLTDLWSEDRKTVVFVTHDIDEAILLADRIIVFSPHPGRVAETLDVEIARPRSFEQTEEADFTKLRHHLRQLIFSMRAEAA